jgi:hypothetical protein
MKMLLILMPSFILLLACVLRLGTHSTNQRRVPSTSEEIASVIIFFSREGDALYSCGE